MTIAAGTLPVVDITQLDSETAGLASTTCIEAIHVACIDTGFFVVVGHGLASEIDELFEAARFFFSLPEAQKEAVPRIDRYGFIPHIDHAMDTDRASLATEFLDMGLGDEVVLPDVAGFEAAVRAYQRAALVTAHSILRALAIALRTEPGFFARHMANPQCQLRFLHYLETPPRADGSLPVPNTPDTDYGVITLVATDGVPGLEGFSIPFFVNPDPATIVDCIPSCVTGDRPSRYEPVTAGDFLASRIDGSAEPYVDPGEGPLSRVIVADAPADGSADQTRVSRSGIVSMSVSGPTM